jgi:carbon-monoxide dehydrogenase large subunit
MTAARKGANSVWVGRSIRRLEDPALLKGRGRFTADVPAAHHVRFVRSPVASGRIVKVTAPDNAMVITAANHGGNRPRDTDRAAGAHRLPPDSPFQR